MATLHSNPSDFTTPRQHRLLRRVAELVTHPAVPDVYLLTPQACDQRGEVENFIREEFRASYGAELRHFLPFLLGIQRRGEWVGAAGLRPALGTSLFLENYLDDPVEQRLSALCGEPVPRGRIMEIGNLAGTQPGISHFLFPLLTMIFAERDHQWAICTATQTVQNILSRLGYPFLRVGAANPRRLGEQALQWGSYYQQPTHVIAINVAAAGQAMANTEGMSPLLARYRETLQAQWALLPAGSDRNS